MRAFTVSQPRPVRLAAHTHALAMVQLAVKRNIPIVILICRPVDTVVSATMKAPGTTMQQHLRWYIRYYEQIYLLRNYLHIALFDEVVQDFGAVIQQVNRCFNKQFTLFNSTPENVKAVLSGIEAVDRHLYKDDISRFSFPIKEKDGFEKSLREQLERENPLLLEKADHLYKTIANDRC